MRELQFIHNRNQNFFSKYGCGVSFVVGMLASAVAILGFNLPTLIEGLMALGILITVPGVVFALSERMKKPKTSQEQEDLETKLNLIPYAHSIDQKRLHKDVDYTIAQLLEASAYYFYRIDNQLSQPMWIGDSASLHFRSVREEILTAARSSMRHASALALRCMAPKGARRTPVDDIVDSIGDLDLHGILDGFKKSLAGQKGYRSEFVSEVYGPIREIAEGLKTMSEEVEKLTVSAHRVGTVADPSPKHLLDDAVLSLRELQRASKELDDGDSPSVHLRQER